MTCMFSTPCCCRRSSVGRRNSHPARHLIAESASKSSSYREFVLYALYVDVALSSATSRLMPRLMASRKLSIQALWNQGHGLLAVRHVT